MFDCWGRSALRGAPGQRLGRAEGSVGTTLIAGVGWLHPRIRRLETEIPDQIPDSALAPLH